jgi:hypothetical protein
MPTFNSPNTGLRRWPYQQCEHLVNTCLCPDQLTGLQFGKIKKTHKMDTISEFQMTAWLSLTSIIYLQPDVHKPRATEFCTMSTNICYLNYGTCFRSSFFMPRIWRWLLDLLGNLEMAPRSFGKFGDGSLGNMCLPVQQLQLRPSGEDLFVYFYLVIYLLMYLFTSI